MANRTMDQINVQRWANSLRQFHRHNFQNIDTYQLATASSPSTNNNNRRLVSLQYFVPTSSEFSASLNDLLLPSSRTFSTVTDVCLGSQNGIRNPSTTIKIKEAESPNSNQYSFTLDLTPSVNKSRKDFNHPLKSQFHTFDMTTKDEKDLHSLFELDAQFCDNKSSMKFPNDSTLLTPSSDHRDIDTLSDAGTYIIDDDADIARDDEVEQKVKSSPFKGYATKTKYRHGTFDIHGLLSSSAHTINRPVVHSNIPTHVLPSLSSNSSSSSSSPISFPTEKDNNIRKEREDVSHRNNEDKSSNDLIYAKQRPTTLLQQQSKQIKPAECFVISPTLEAKPFPNTATGSSRRKVEAPFKPKLSSKVSTSVVVPTKDSNLELTKPQSLSSSSPPHSLRSTQSETEKYSFHLQQQPPLRNLKSSLQNSEQISSSSSKTSIRPHAAINDQTYSPSSFQNNPTSRPNIPASMQSQRPLSSSSTINNDHSDENTTSHPNLTKVYMNKSFALRRQHANHVPSTPVQQQQHQPVLKPTQQQMLTKTLSRQSSKPTTAIQSSSVPNSSGQTNRAVELRRARAQAKIEELSQRTRRQLLKTELQTDLMSGSWHSHASSTSKKDFLNARSNPRATARTTITPHRQDMLTTRTISTPSHHRSSSASPYPTGETTLRNRKAMISSVTVEQQNQRMTRSTYSNETERCDSLRDNGQRLAIKLIQLSSGILEKLKPNDAAIDDDANERELEQLIDKLQTVNRTLSSIDASLSGPTNDDAFA